MNNFIMLLDAEGIGENKAWWEYAGKFTVDSVIWILKTIFTALTPFIEYGGKFLIIGAFICYAWSKDKHMLSKCMYIGLIYFLFFVILGALNAYE